MVNYSTFKIVFVTMLLILSTFGHLVDVRKRLHRLSISPASQHISQSTFHTKIVTNRDYSHLKNINVYSMSTPRWNGRLRVQNSLFHHFIHSHDLFFLGFLLSIRLIYKNAFQLFFTTSISTCFFKGPVYVSITFCLLIFLLFISSNFLLYALPLPPRFGIRSRPLAFKKSAAA